MKFLSPEAFYNYQQFIKTTSLNYYDKETEEKINEFLDLYKITNSYVKFYVSVLNIFFIFNYFFFYFWSNSFK
jgi:hypothetical protein